MNKVLVGVVFVVSLLALGGCSKPPATEIAAADASIDQATAAEAAEYAPESMQAVSDARAKLDAELKAQEEKFSWFRSYDDAKIAAEELRAAAQKAEQDAVEARRVAREEAAQLISDVRTTLDEVKTMLDKAPRGKGSEVDIAVLKGDLAGIETSLVEMEGAFAAEDYLESKAQATAALEGTQKVRSEIERAIELSKNRTRRG